MARGLVAYDAIDAVQIAGRGTRDIEPILGYAGRKEIIHRDDLAFSGDGQGQAEAMAAPGGGEEDE